MAPLLIDSRDQLKLVFIFVLAALLVFGSGFVIGHQKAETYYQAENVIHTLELPIRTSSTENIDTQVPEIVEAGEAIDVDQPEEKPNVALPEKLFVGQKKSENQTKSENKVVDTPVTVTSGYSSLATSRTEPGDNRGADISDQHHVNKLTIVDAGIRPASIDDLSKVKYSIQIGMYGSMINAENMMKILQAKLYDAYITDYTNRKNETRYNVRYGYFSNKKSAIESLQKYKGDNKGDGYLVKFSAENIVNVADATDSSKMLSAPTASESVEDDATPATMPAVDLQDKISQADIQNDVLTRTN